MPFDKLDIESINEERREAIAKSIRTISAEEVKKLGAEIFHDIDEPWRDTFFKAVAQNPAGTFYQAVTSEGAIFLYSREADKGLWFLPGSGKGPLPTTGLQMMRDAIARGGRGV
jgi:hypothetical protein